MRDIAHAESDKQKADVLAVLAQLAKDSGGKAPPVLEAWNKIDLLDDATREARMRRAQTALEAGRAPSPPVAISAETGEGMDALLAAIDRAAFSATRVITLTLPPDDRPHPRADRRRRPHPRRNAPTKTATSRCAPSSRSKTPPASRR